MKDKKTAYNYNFHIFSEDLKLNLVGASQLKSKPAVKDLGFGKHFTDHMLRIKVF